MRVGGLDLETTGFDQTTGDRIVEICLRVYEDGVFYKELNKRVNPQRPIPAAATNVHGITYAMVDKCEPFDYYAGPVAVMLSELDELVIHNAEFDMGFIFGEMARCGVSFKLPKVTCTMKGARWATYDGKSPKLIELCAALGIEFDPTLAHGAEYDVSKMMECFFLGRKLGFL